MTTPPRRVEPLSADTSVEMLAARARLSPDALAFGVGVETISYGALWEDAQRLAAALAARGLGPGHRCALVLPTSLDFVRALFAVQLTGAAPVAIDPRLAAERTARLLSSLRCADVLTAEKVAALRDLPPSQGLAVRPPGPANPAFLQLTSGSTGEPRAAVIRQSSLMAALAGALQRLAVREDDVLVTWVPLHHNVGLVRFVFGALYFGRPAHLVPPSATNLRAWLETASRVRATITGSPDFGYRIAAQTVDPRGLDLRALRIAVTGGEAVGKSTIEQFERRFGLEGVMRPAYGLAEATMGVSLLAPGEPLRYDAAGAASCGRPYPGVEVRIMGGDGAPLPPGESGEICVRGATVFAGYFDDPAGTREMLRDGWLWTGDLGRLDADGYLYVSGRRRTLIKRAGAPVFPREVEEIVAGVAGVVAAAAIGIPARTLAGSEDLAVVAEVRPARAGGEALAELAGAIAHAVAQALGFAPARVVLVTPDALPRTPSGKVLHMELRKRMLDGTLARSSAFLVALPDFSPLSQKGPPECAPPAGRW
jgi:acyl-CoA synthetase (AMP-forming)/AMP-acid ligase II